MKIKSVYHLTNYQMKLI